MEYTFNHRNNWKFKLLEPSLFQPTTDQLWLFYKTGKTVEKWAGHMLISYDCGESWSRPFTLPSDSLGSTRNPLLQLEDGWVLAPSSREIWIQRFPVFERFRYDDNEIQQISLKSEDNLSKLLAIQPSLVQRPDQSILVFCRTNLNFIYETQSFDGGLSWSPLKATDWYNPDSAITTLTMKNGFYLAANLSRTSRSRLQVVFVPWGNSDPQKKVIEFFHKGKPIAYPSLINLDDQELLIAYSISQKEICLRRISSQ